jgi:hypothetical protein
VPVCKRGLFTQNEENSLCPKCSKKSWELPARVKDFQRTQ